MRAASSNSSRSASPRIRSRNSFNSSRSLPSSSNSAACRWRAYSSRSTGSTHGPRQRLIWYSIQGRARFLKTPSRADARRKNLAYNVDRLAQSVRRAKRAEVAATVFHDPAGDRDPRPCVIRDFCAEIRLVVFEPDIVARPVLLDQVIFENQRFFFVTRDQRLEVAHAAHQEAHLKTTVAPIAEIRTDARTQGLGLAD